MLEDSKPLTGFSVARSQALSQHSARTGGRAIQIEYPPNPERFTTAIVTSQYTKPPTASVGNAGKRARRTHHDMLPQHHVR